MLRIHPYLTAGVSYVGPHLGPQLLPLTTPDSKSKGEGQKSQRFSIAKSGLVTWGLPLPIAFDLSSTLPLRRKSSVRDFPMPREVTGPSFDQRCQSLIPNLTMNSRYLPRDGQDVARNSLLLLQRCSYDRSV